MNPYITVAVVAIGGVLIYRMCKKSAPPKALNPQSSEMGVQKGQKPYALQTIVQQDDVSHTQPDPLNLQSNQKHLNLLKTEIGPHGVPRKIYQGPGGSRINAHGSNYGIL